MINQNNYFNTRYSFNKKRMVVWKAITEYLQKYICDECSVLELGSGYGDFINQIKSKDKVAIDFDNDAKKHCNTDVFFVNASIFDFNIEKKFDVIFASNFLEHFTQLELDVVLGKISELLNKNGKLILIQPNYYYCYRNYWDDYTHKTVFSHVNFPDFLIAKGFLVKVLKKRFLPFSFKSKLPASYLLTKLYMSSPIKPFAKQLLIVAEKNV
jgi:SAM-dependent methyltransferase